MVLVECDTSQKRPKAGRRLPYLRQACPSDAADLQRNCFPEQSLEEVQTYLSWSLAQMEIGRLVRLVAEADGEVIASGQLAILRHEGEIGSLAVAPAYRRRGIGTALMRALVQEGRRRGLHALEIMADANASWLAEWYRRLGFVDQGERTLPRDERLLVLRMSL